MNDSPPQRSEPEASSPTPIDAREAQKQQREQERQRKRMERARKRAEQERLRAEREAARRESAARIEARRQRLEQDRKAREAKEKERAETVKQQAAQRAAEKAAREAQKEQQQQERLESQQQRELEKMRRELARERQKLEQERQRIQKLSASKPRDRKRADRTLNLLEACFELNVNEHMSPQLRDSLLYLQDETLDDSSELDLVQVCRNSLTLIEQFKEHLSSLTRTLQKEKLAIGDMNQNRQRLIVKPRKAVDQSFQDFQAAVQVQKTDWTARIQKQRNQVEVTFKNTLSEHLDIHEEMVADGAAYTVAVDYWSRFVKWSEMTFDTWEAQVTKGANASFDKELGKLGSNPIAAGRTPGPPPQRSLNQLTHQTITDTLPPPVVLEVPSFAAAFFQSLRSNLMTMGILAMIIGAPLIPLLLGEGAAQGGNSLVMRYLLAAPFAVTVAIYTGRQERKKRLRKAREEGKAKIHKQLLDDVRTELSNRQARLAGWIDKRHRDQKKAANDWRKRVLEPELRAAEMKANQKLKQIQLKLSDIGSQQSRISATLNDVQRLLPRLRVELQRLSR